MCRLSDTVMDFIWLSTFLAIVNVVLSFPTQTLSERNQDISWQAWLLVDDQNQHGRTEEGAMRRRIVPKSVFIAPTFSPDSLPSCSEGYSQDAMLRCIKIIKLDEDARLSFLVDKLNDKFGALDYGQEISEGGPSSEAPFQLNIPLGDYDDSTDNTAIIVSPTSKIKQDLEELEIQLDKKDDDEDEDLEKDLVRLARTTTKNYDPKAETTTDTQDGTTQTTTLEPLETTTITPEEILTTTFESIEPTTTFTEAPSTTLDVLEQELLENKHTPTTTEVTTTDESFTTSTPSVTTYHPKLLLTTTEPTTRANKILFPDSKPTETTLYDFVKFPDSIDSKTRSGLHTRDLNKQIHEYAADTPRVSWSFPDDPTTERSYHRRNRERHNSLFLLQPKWDHDGVQKPLMLKISQRNGFVDTDRFRNVFHKAVPQQDFSFWFRAHDR